MTGDAALVAQQKPVFVRFLSSVQFATADNERRWPVPVGWQEVPGGQFLVAKFAIAGGASVNVSSSAGNGGGLAANVNRWRKQLGLDEMAGDQIAKSVTTSGEVTLVTLTGANASLVGAIVTRPGQTWFYKLMGDAKIVAAQKDAFIKFVNEVKY